MTTGRSQFDKGDLVWFDPGIGYVLPGEVMEFHRAGQVITIQAVIAGKPQVFTLDNLSSVKRRQDLGQSGCEDMIQMLDLNEASLLWNLKIRYDKELIYTYTGSILVAVNPYKMFDIYGLDVVKKYEGQILGTLPPHLFAIGSSAYGKMNKDQENQVVVISGESGAGKTESTKLVMQYLAAVNKSPSNLITEQILEASPLLESFGNAKTGRNDNSSRFGKYLEVHFKSGVITGAKITEYLLEKSRIVTHAADERNYHVFYEMLKGLTSENKENYGLLTAEKYFYLNQGSTCEIDGKYDGEDFQSLLSAMQVLGFTSEEQDTIFRILASVLHLGNVFFNRKALKHGQEGVDIGSDAEIKWAGHLLQLNVDGIRRALTTRTTEARNDRVVTPLNIDQALDVRDAIAKSLYSSLFTWLVARINQIVYKGTKKTAISILDIFGFEEFKENSFEQLCINYANENLQYYFNKHIFKLEQLEYAKEKIEWQTITYQDNQPVISLIARKPVGIFHLLDDESNFPKASDLSFLEKCHYNHALDELYSRPRMSSMEFGIKHYAGQVWYNVEGFLDKNRDTLRHDVIHLLISSKVPMISNMFQEMLVTSEAAKTINKANGRFVTMKPRTPTVAARFHDSLQQLLESMSRCNPWFVRCIKPNNDKAPMKLDMPIVLEQLRYTGMLETIRIRKMGYPIRMRFSQFADRYRCLVTERLPRGAPSRDVSRVILERRHSSHGQFQLGTSKVFLRESLEQKLEKERYDLLNGQAVHIQKHVRRYLARKRYNTMKRNAVKIQANVRGWIERRKYQQLRKGVVKAQAIYRMKRQMKLYNDMKENLKRRAQVERVSRERSKVKAQKDEAERISRAVAGVNHLEIPAELAFIFSKVDDWQEVHTERNLVKVVGQVPEINDNYYLPHDIDYHAFTKFTNVYFKSHLWGMKREPIKTPFLAKSKDIDYHDSLALFKLILRFMNDSNLSGKKELVLGNYIVNKGIINEKMRDEILCQLCNQTWKNDNEANRERGWLLMANCLSVFPPSKILYKYLLKYVSDHGYNGYKAHCQQKLLQSAKIEAQLARNYPPCLLEWISNRKRANMALEVQYADGKTRNAPVTSWTTGEEFASYLVQERGIKESNGWTVSLTEEGCLYELNGCDYILDLISEMELPPAFPVCKNFFLMSNSKGDKQKMGLGTFSANTAPLTVEVHDYPPPSARRPTQPPPEPPTAKLAARKVSREMILEKHLSSQQVPKEKKRSIGKDEMPPGPSQKVSESSFGLSRQSALNDRYFEEKKKGRSRSLDNLLDDSKPSKETSHNIQNFGLSQSKLNERYHSMEMLEPATPPPVVHNRGYNAREEVMDKIFQEERRIVKEGKPWSPHGLSKSSLNDRYFVPSPLHVTKPVDLSDSGSDVSQSRMDTNEQQLRRRISAEVISHRRESAEYGGFRDSPVRGGHVNGHSNGASSSPSPDGPRETAMEGPMVDLSEFVYQERERQDDEKTNYSHGPPRYIKAQNASKRSVAGSHSSRAYIEGRYSEKSEKSEYGATKSSALSDTSEAPSLASHVRRVRVPSQASDVDQFLDDLFMPVLDGNLDELSDARSLSASIKGGRVTEPVTRDDLEVASLTNVDDYISELFDSVFVNSSVEELTDASILATALKGGGSGIGSVMETQSPQNPGANAAFGFTPIPGMTSPPPMLSGMVSPPPMMMPIYTPGADLGAGPGTSTPTKGNVPAGGAPTSPLMFSYMPMPIYNMQGFNIPGYQMGNGGNNAAGNIDVNQVAAYQQNIQRAYIQSAMAQNMQIQQQLLAQNQALQQLLQQQAVSFQEPEENNKRPGSGSKRFVTSPPPPPPQPTYKNNHNSYAQNEFNHRAHSGHGIPPPPPPMPPEPLGTDPSDERPFLDPYGRAKTVRIGKWRWPPPKNDEEELPFIEFKMLRQQQRKSTSQLSPHKDMAVQQNGNASHQQYGGVEWDEFDMANAGESRNNSRNSGGGHYNNNNNKEEKRNSRDYGLDPREKELITAFENSTPKPSVGSIGKLRISNEMRQKLELVTANHSVRSSVKSEKRGFLPPKDDVPERVVKKLEENRKLMLEQQLGGRKWDSVISVEELTCNATIDDSVDLQQVNLVRHQVEKMEKARGEDKNNRRPATNAQHHFDAMLMMPQRPPSASSSYYTASNAHFPEAKSHPPPAIQPTGANRNNYVMQRIERERRASVLTEKTDKMDKIEIEESSEFLKPVDTPPVILDRDFELRTLENMKTKLYPSNGGPCFTYNRVNWMLHVRKEVFTPSESVANPLALHLIYCQVVQDTFNNNCIRISREERNKMKQMLDSYGVKPSNLHSPHIKVTIKKNIIDIAKEWPTYFSRLFPVSGGRQNVEVQLLSISHSGVRFVRREKSTPSDYLQVLDSFSFEDIAETSVPKGSLLQIDLHSGARFTFYTHRANQICSMIDRYSVEVVKSSQEFVRAVTDYVTQESTLLSFRRGDVIRVVNKDQYLEKGWLYGILDGRTGIFPCEYVEAVSRHELQKATKVQDVQDGMVHDSPVENGGGGVVKQIRAEHEAATWTESRNEIHDEGGENQTSLVHDGKHSLLQFAMHYFRQSPEKFELLKNYDGSLEGSLKMIESLKGKNKGKGKKGKAEDWTWKELVDMVKFTNSPLQESLLRLESPELNKLAIECFVSIMRYMGDYPMTKGGTEVECVYTILRNCHKHDPVRDEVYCQIMKQTTNNKSARPDSCQRGWRLFSILAAYFTCSNILKPYLMKYLETASYDKRRAYHGTATVCLKNLRKTFKYGGRRNVPSVEEITAITAGRNSKRQIYRLPGGTERVINTKSTTVVQDIIEEICSVINVRSQHEMEEFSLYCIVEGDTFTMPLAREEYILDVTTELHKNQQMFYLIFCRSVWYYPLRLDNQLYIEVVFNQVVPDYLEGLFLILPGEQLQQNLVYDIAKLAALLHAAAGVNYLPTLKETKYLLPKLALAVRDIKPPQWVNMVQSSWRDVEGIQISQAKAQVLEILQKWPLFGSSFFAIKRVSDPKERSDYILALNRNGVHFLNIITHETMMHYTYADVISTRKVKSEDGTLYLDMKCGNLMQQKITRIQTDQAHEISRLIRQYINIEQRNNGIVQPVANGVDGFVR